MGMYDQLLGVTQQGLNNLGQTAQIGAAQPTMADVFMERFRQGGQDQMAREHAKAQATHYDAMNQNYKDQRLQGLVTLGQKYGGKGLRDRVVALGGTPEMVPDEGAEVAKQRIRQQLGERRNQIHADRVSVQNELDRARAAGVPEQIKLWQSQADALDAKADQIDALTAQYYGSEDGAPSLFQRHQQSKIFRNENPASTDPRNPQVLGASFRVQQQAMTNAKGQLTSGWLMKKPAERKAALVQEGVDDATATQLAGIPIPPFDHPAMKKVLDNLTQREAQRLSTRPGGDAVPEGE